MEALEKGYRKPGAELDDDEVRALLDRAAPFDELFALRDAETGIRHRPTTDRGAKTFDAILDAAQKVLMQQGIRGITTRKVSDEAGVNIATLYQYFDDIEAIMLALSLRFQIGQTTLLYERSLDLARGKDFGDWMFDLTSELARIRLENESLTALIYATRALPYLHPVVNLGWEAGARLFATAAAIKDPRIDSVELLPAMRAANSVVRLTLDDTVSRDPFDRERYELVCQMAYDFLLPRVTPDE